MPIEFACTNCGKQLRTPDETAGRQAKCPQCGAIMQIPHPAVAAPIEPPPAERGPAGGVDWNPFASPAIGGESASRTASAVAGEITPARADVSSVFSETQAIFGRNLGLCLLLGLSMLVIYFVFGAIVNVLSIAFGVGAFVAAPGQGIPGRQVGALVAWALVVILIGWLFYSWLYMGIVRCFLNLARGKRTHVGDLLSGAPYALRALAINLIFVVTGIIGYALAIAAIVAVGNPGAAFLIMVLLFVAWVVIYLSVSQSFHLVVDRDLGAMDAIRTSMSVMSGNKLALFLVGLGLFVLMIVVAFVFGLAQIMLMRVFGLAGAVLTFLAACALMLAATSFVFLLLSVFYLHVTGQPTANTGGAVR